MSQCVGIPEDCLIARSAPDTSDDQNITHHLSEPLNVYLIIMYAVMELIKVFAQTQSVFVEK